MLGTTERNTLATNNYCLVLSLVNFGSFLSFSLTDKPLLLSLSTYFAKGRVNINSFNG